MTTEQITDSLRECYHRAACEFCKCEPFCDGVFVMHEQAADLIESLSAQLEQVKRERDALYDDFRSFALGFGDECSYCRFCEWEGVKGTCKRPEIIAEETGEEVEGGTLICIWEWRGPCEENGGQQDER